LLRKFAFARFGAGCEPNVGFSGTGVSLDVLTTVEPAKRS
jgi:hypothetical protein